MHSHVSNYNVVKAAICVDSHCREGTAWSFDGSTGSYHLHDLANEKVSRHSASMCVIFTIKYSQDRHSSILDLLVLRALRHLLGISQTHCEQNSGDEHAVAASVHIHVGNGRIWL